FIDYYIIHEAQWRMITHFALHGKNNKGSLSKLNDTGRDLMNLFELVFKKIGATSDTRLLAHTLFSCLSGVLISFRNYPGRKEEERVTHMKKVGSVIGQMILALVENHK
ncbi:MAG: TetR/AcrR family transcriptional regulator, partial [Desulfobacteraceae bacterium]|nr:TetR/AcrR family transcriptional regulator [Desulfobacteraceae bacterium]